MFNKELFEQLCDRYNVRRTSEYSHPMLSVNGEIIPLTRENVHRALNVFTRYNFACERNIVGKFIDWDEYFFDDEVLIA